MRNTVKRRRGSSLVDGITSLLKTAFWVAGALSTFVALYAFFSSSIAVTPSDPLSENPASAPFVISNTSQFFTLKEVKASCDIDLDEVGTKDAFLASTGWDHNPTIPDLGPGGTDTINCGQAGAKFQDYTTRAADIVITVEYKLSIVAFYQKRSMVRFITRRTNDGRLRWVPYGLHDVDPRI
jgi:hypothetical protein